MSRVGKKPVEIEEGVSAQIERGAISIKGPKGELTLNYDSLISCEQKENQIHVICKHTTKELRAKHGLYRALIQNMVAGVTKGFEKTLELVGIGFRAHQKGNDLGLSLGFSHPINFKTPEGITVKVIGTNKIIISGIDKQLVGETTAKIRELKVPDKYKNKGIRYQGEKLIKKQGKSVKK